LIQEHKEPEQVLLSQQKEQKGSTGVMAIDPGTQSLIKRKEIGVP